MFNVLISKADYRRLRKRDYCLAKDEKVATVYNQNREPVLEITYDEEINVVIIMTKEGIQYVDEACIYVSQEPKEKPEYSTVEYFKTEEGKGNRISIII